MIYKIFNRQRCQPNSGLAQGLAGPLLRPLVARRIQGLRDTGSVAAVFSGGFRSVFLLTTGSLLARGQLCWYKPAEHHSCLWELVGVLSKAISTAHFLLQETGPGLPSAYPSLRPSHGFLPDQVELFSICPLEPWETHTSLKSQTRECSRLFQVSSCCQLPPVPCLPAQIGEGYSSKSVSKTFLASCQRMRRYLLQVPPPIFNRGFSQSCFHSA